MRRLLVILCAGFGMCVLALAQGTPTTPLGPPTTYLSATDLLGNPVAANVYLTGGGALADYIVAGSFYVFDFPPLNPGTDGDGIHFDFGSWEWMLLSTSRSCQDVPYPFPANGSPCFGVHPVVQAGTWAGVVAPLSIVAAGQPMVFHDWEVVDPEPGACRTGNMGIRAIPSDPVKSGQAATAFLEGVEERLKAFSPAGTDPADQKIAHFRAVYAPASPDVSPPLVTVDTPRDCMQIPRGSAASVSFSCRDLGSGMQSCTSTPGYGNGATIDSSTLGNHAFTVTATDNTGNIRTRTIRYSIVDVTPPTAAPAVPPANAYGWFNTDVTVSWNWYDDAGGTGIDPAHCAPTSTSVGEGASIVVSGTCQDLAGNQKTASVTVNVDKTAPQADIRISPNLVVQGTSPQVLATWADGLSGMAASGCGALPTNAPGTFNLACSGSDRAGNMLPLQIPYTVVLANGEYLFWHSGDLSSTMNRINVDGTGRTSFPVLPNARNMSANGTYLYYNPDTDPMVSDGGAYRTDLDGGSVYQVVDGIIGVYSLAATTSYIYFHNEVNLLKAYPDGQEVGAWFQAPFVVAADDTYVYAAEGGAIVRAGVDGSNPMTLFAGPDGVRALARSGDWVYWIDDANGNIGRVKTDGTNPTANLIGVNATALAVSSSYVFWANGGDTTIGRANLDGTGVQASFITNDGGIVGHMAAGGTPVFDSTAPSIQITSPANGVTYRLNQSVAADYNCTDGAGGSGLASCVGTVATGAAIDTSAYGTRTFTVTARDFSGNERTASATYTVGYVFGGFASPIDAAPTVNSGIAGKTYPIKFQLLDNGAPVSDLAAVSSLTYLPTTCGAFAGNPSDALETDTSGNTSLRYDSGSSSFIYNWKTPKAAGCYTLWLNLRTGQQFPIYFHLR